MSEMEMRIAKMTDRIAKAESDGESDTPLEMVDQAIDNMIASAMVIDKYLPKVKVDNVPQKAAVDSIRELMDEAIAPYLADIAQAAQIFGD